MRIAALIAFTILAAACAAPSTPSQHSGSQPHLPPPDFDAIEAPEVSESPYLQDPSERPFYLHYNIEENCGADGATGSYRITPEACHANYDPVCGCDGETYGNACVANTGGMSVKSEGECPS